MSARCNVESSKRIPNLKMPQDLRYGGKPIGVHCIRWWGVNLECVEGFWRHLNRSLHRLKAAMLLFVLYLVLCRKQSLTFPFRLQATKKETRKIYSVLVLIVRAEIIFKWVQNSSGEHSEKQETRFFHISVLKLKTGLVPIVNVKRLYNYRQRAEKNTSV